MQNTEINYGQAERHWINGRCYMHGLDRVRVGGYAEDESDWKLSSRECLRRGSLMFSVLGGDERVRKIVRRQERTHGLAGVPSQDIL